jgi:hypothetical protein
MTATYSAEDIINYLRRSFSDFDFIHHVPFNDHALPVLTTFVSRTHTDFSINSTDLLSTYGHQPVNSKLDYAVRLVLVCAHLLLYEHSTNNNTDNANAIPVNEEDRYLGQFRKYLRLGMALMPANRNKGLLIDAASRLEGSSLGSYSFGTGQTREATSRENLFYELSGLPRPKPRIKRALINDHQPPQQHTNNENHYHQQLNERNNHPNNNLPSPYDLHYNQSGLLSENTVEVLMNEHHVDFTDTCRKLEQ